MCSSFSGGVQLHLLPAWVIPAAFIKPSRYQFRDVFFGSGAHTVPHPAAVALLCPSAARCRVLGSAARGRERVRQPRGSRGRSPCAGRCSGPGGAGGVELGTGSPPHGSCAAPGRRVFPPLRGFVALREARIGSDGPTGKSCVPSLVPGSLSCCCSPCSL